MPVKKRKPLVIIYTGNGKGENDRRAGNAVSRLGPRHEGLHALLHQARDVQLR